MQQITNYGELKEAVKTWLNRKDKHTVDNIPVFINFAEKQIYRNLRIPAFEGEVLVTVSNDGSISVPYDVIEFKHLFKADTKQTLSRVEMPYLSTAELGYSRTTTFIWFSEDIKPGDKIRIVYYRDQHEIGPADSDTNILLTIAPDLFLYTALRSGARFTNDVEEVGKWDALAKDAYNNITVQAVDLEYSGGVMEISTHKSEV